MSVEGVPFEEPRELLATSKHADRRALVIAPTEPSPATDATLSRIETVMNLLQLARFSAAALATDSTSEHDRLQAGLLGSALDEALAEQRILWLELAPTMTGGTDGPSRYRDVTGTR